MFSIIIREIQVKITMTYRHYIPGIGEAVEKLGPSDIASGNVKWYIGTRDKFGSFLSY